MWLTNFEKTSCLKAERSKIEGAVDRIEDFVYWECFIVGKMSGRLTFSYIIGSLILLGRDIFFFVFMFDTRKYKRFNKMELSNFHGI